MYSDQNAIRDLSRAAPSGAPHRQVGDRLLSLFTPTHGVAVGMALHPGCIERKMPFKKAIFSVYLVASSLFTWLASRDGHIFGFAADETYYLNPATNKTIQSYYTYAF